MCRFRKMPSRRSARFAQRSAVGVGHLSPLLLVVHFDEGSGLVALAIFAKLGADVPAQALVLGVRKHDGGGRSSLLS